MERKQQRKKGKEQRAYYLNKQLDRWKDTKTKTYAISRQRKQYLPRQNERQTLHSKVSPDGRTDRQSWFNQFCLAAREIGE